LPRIEVARDRSRKPEPVRGGKTRSLVPGLSAVRLGPFSAIAGKRAESVFVAIAPGPDGGKVDCRNSNPPRRVQEVLMTVINTLIIAALVATIVVLVMGLRSMARGGTYDREHAEKFMWERVALQALAILLLLVAAFLLNK
jgi:hypothetical protein